MERFRSHTSISYRFDKGEFMLSSSNIHAHFHSHMMELVCEISGYLQPIKSTLYECAVLCVVHAVIKMQSEPPSTSVICIDYCKNIIYINIDKCRCNVATPHPKLIIFISFVMLDHFTNIPKSSLKHSKSKSFTLLFVSNEILNIVFIYNL